MAANFAPSFKVLKHRSIVLIEPEWLTSKKGRRLIDKLLAAGITCALVSVRK